MAIFLQLTLSSRLFSLNKLIEYLSSLKSITPSPLRSNNLTPLKIYQNNLFMRFLSLWTPIEFIIISNSLLSMNRTNYTHSNIYSFYSLRARIISMWNMILTFFVFDEPFHYLKPEFILALFTKFSLTRLYKILPQMKSIPCSFCLGMSWLRRCFTIWR